MIIFDESLLKCDNNLCIELSHVFLCLYVCMGVRACACEFPLVVSSSSNSQMWHWGRERGRSGEQTYAFSQPQLA